MKNTAARFSFVLAGLLMLSTSVYAKGRPTMTYSWSVVISGTNLEPVEGSTYTVRTSSGANFSELTFEALAPDSKVQFTDLSGFVCEKGDCGKMFDAIGANHEGTIQQPDGTTYKRVKFQAYFNYLDFEHMGIGESQTRNMTQSSGAGFVIDKSYPSDMKNYIWVELHDGPITITRTSESQWEIDCAAGAIGLTELEAQTQLVCKPRGCKEVAGPPQEVSHGTAGAMAFTLEFTRSQH